MKIDAPLWLPNWKVFSNFHSFLRLYVEKFESEWEKKKRKGNLDLYCSWKPDYSFSINMRPKAGGKKDSKFLTLLLSIIRTKKVTI